MNKEIPKSSKVVVIGRGSLGAALALWFLDQNNERKVNSSDNMKGSYLGPEFTQDKLKLNYIYNLC